MDIHFSGVFLKSYLSEKNGTLYCQFSLDEEGEVKLALPPGVQAELKRNMRYQITAKVVPSVSAQYGLSLRAVQLTAKAL